MKSSAKWFAGVAAIVLLLTGLVARVSAEDPKKDPPKENPVGKETAQEKAGRTLMTAAAMADIGRENKLPEVLIAAAKLYGTLKVKAPEGSKGKPSLDPSAEAKKLLKEAEEMPEATLTHKKLIAAVRTDLEANRGDGAIIIIIPIDDDGETDTRTLWRYSGGYFKKTGPTTWKEANSDGDHPFTFAGYTDPNKRPLLKRGGVWVSLATDRAFLSQDGGNSWSVLYYGCWVEP